MGGQTDIVRCSALLVQIQKVLGLNLGLETETEGVCTTHQFLQANVRQYFKTDLHGVILMPLTDKGLLLNKTYHIPELICNITATILATVA
jgi:hypothetical protein